MSGKNKNTGCESERTLGLIYCPTYRENNESKDYLEGEELQPKEAILEPLLEELIQVIFR